MVRPPPHLESRVTASLNNKHGLHALVSAGSATDGNAPIVSSNARFRDASACRASQFSPRRRDCPPFGKVEREPPLDPEPEDTEPEPVCTATCDQQQTN
jgi:hypothetical protein